ncbi:MAG TPA: LysR family transcriptional regulator [Bdellovibrio sp.]|uniref:LysR family transcriptional regulator n=1 Tax=Bdellovibrio sp. TaxID=28201 RepID=UPI002F116627
MDSTHSMRIFINVADLESFTRAADTMGLPKATVSAAVQQLEAELGARLLNRTTRTVRLTQDGQLFYERCRSVLSDFDELQGMFQQAPKDLSGKVRIDLPSRLARQLVISHLPQFNKLFPKIEIELGVTDRFVDLIQEGVDFAVRGGNLQDSSLIARPLGRRPQVNLVSAGYIKKYGKPKSIEDLSNHFAVNYSSRMGMRAAPADFEYFEDGKVHNIPMKSLITVNNAETYLECCLAGYGIIQVPNSHLQDFIKSGQLVEVLPKHLPEPMTMSIVYPSRRHVSRRALALMEWMEALIKKDLKG